MHPSNSRSSDDTIERPLADRLRTALFAARANMRIRESLKRIIDDPERFDPIVGELGPNHALIRDLLELGRHVETTADASVDATSDRAA